MPATATKPNTADAKALEAQAAEDDTIPDTEDTSGQSTTSGLVTTVTTVTNYFTPNEWRLTEEEQRVLDAGQDAQRAWELRVDRALAVRRMPYAVWLTTSAVGALSWWIGEVSAHPLAVAPVTSAAVIGIAAGVRWAKRKIVNEAWRRRIWMTGTVSALWTAIATIAPDPRLLLIMVGTLFVLQHVLSSKPRHDHPIPAGTGIEGILDANPAIESGEGDENISDEVVEQYAQRWDDNVATTDGGALPGSSLTDGEGTPYAVRYTLHLKPGKQSYNKLCINLDNIASGIGVKKENILPEPHPATEDPAVLSMTFVLRSPVRESRMWAGPSLITGGGSKCSVVLGRYADGVGDASWELWRSSGMRNGLIIGGTRSGKGGLSGVLVSSARASGAINTIYVDPQGGMSSPGIGMNATVSILGQEASDRALDVVEAIAKSREARGGIDKNASSRKSMFANAKSKFMPSPEQPGWLVLVDECSMIFPNQAEAWGNLAARCLKLGICIIAMTQNAGLISFGTNRLRSALAQNYVALKTESKQDGQLMPGLPADPVGLPDMAGFGYLKNDERSGVPFRGDWLPERDDRGIFSEEPPWMLEDAMEENGEPSVCDADRKALLNLIGQPDEDGMWTVVGDESFIDDDDGSAVPATPSTPRTSKLFNTGSLPPMPTPWVSTPVQLTEADQKVLAAIQKGKVRTKSIKDEADVSNAQVHRCLSKLHGAGLVSSHGAGFQKRWKPADKETEENAEPVTEE